MAGSQQKVESDRAADKALKSVSVDLVERLNLSDTTLRLYAMDALDRFELQKLQNIAIIELERKQYLVTNVLPRKGHYRGMMLLRRALEQAGENEILNILDEAYENSVRAIVSAKTETEHEIEESLPSGFPVQATSSECYDEMSVVCKDGEGNERRHRSLDIPTRSSSSSSSSDDGDDGDCHGPLVEGELQPQSADMSLHSPVQVQSENVTSLVAECQESDIADRLDAPVEQQHRPLSDSASLELQHQPISDSGLLDCQVEQQPLVILEQKPQPLSDDASSLITPLNTEQPPQPLPDSPSHDGQVKQQPLIAEQKPQAHDIKATPVVVEQRTQPQLDDCSSFKAVTKEQQPQSLSDNVSSPVVINQQIQSQLQSDGDYSLKSPVTAEQQPPLQPDNGTSPTQQQSDVTPYFKFRLPPAYSGTVTFAITPSSPGSDQGLHTSPNPNNDKPPEHVSLDAVPKDINNDNTECNGALCNANQDNDIMRSIDQFERDYLVMKFVFIGDAATGKTSLIERYASNRFSDSSKPTTVLDFKCVELTCYGTKYQLHLWDTAGQERFKAFTNIYYRDAVGVFVVYDVTRKTTLEHCEEWKRGIDNTVGDAIPVVLIANKIDCGRLNGKRFSEENGFSGYFETSAKTGKGIQSAIHFMVKKVHHNYQEEEPPSRDPSTTIKIDFDTKTRSRRKCC